MVSEQDVEEFMLSVFPTCPLCGTNKGYDVSGISKNNVQCRSCGAEWASAQLPKGKKLEWLILFKPSKDGKGISVKYKKKSINFWKNFKETEVEAGTISGISIEADDKILHTEIIKSLKDLEMHEAGMGWQDYLCYCPVILLKT